MYPEDSPPVSAGPGRDPVRRMVAGIRLGAIRAFAYIVEVMSKRFVRYGLVLLAGAAVARCSVSSDAGTDPDAGSISLSLSQANGTVRQGGAQTLTATLNRAGPFTGPVVFVVTGQPAGVTAEVSHEHTLGAATIATVTLTVGAQTLPATYQLKVHGIGAGVNEATAAFMLTVTLADQGGFKLTLSAPTLNIAQGASTPTTTVNIARNNFAGPVTLGVDIGDCHGTMPAGVTGVFSPNPATGNSSVLTLTVSAGAELTAHYLSVNGYSATGVIEITPLTVFVVAAGSGLRAVIVPGNRPPSHCGAPQP